MILTAWYANYPIKFSWIKIIIRLNKVLQNKAYYTGPLQNNN